MFREVKAKLLATAVVITLAASAVHAAPSADVQGEKAARERREKLEKQVRHELVTLPYFGVFDNLAYKVDGPTVTLYGQVVRPSTRKDAESRVARLAGVERVVNEIEVLPLSSFDDRIRYQTVREIQRTGGLYRYLLGANPSLHIVVNRGHVTLEGVVSDEGDRRLASFAARSVPGVFSVTNNLRTERGGRY